jgi:hypothetical protein
LLVALSVLSRSADAAPEGRSLGSALEVHPNECFDKTQLANALSVWLHGREVDPRLRIAVEGTDGDAAGITFTLRREDRVVGERHFASHGVPAPR